MFLIIRIALIKQITRNWLTDDNLSNAKWKDLVNVIYVMEKITMRITKSIFLKKDEENG